MGIDVNIPRRVLAAEIVELSKYSDNLRGQRIIDSINKMVRTIVSETASSIFTRTASMMICLVAEHTDEKLRVFADRIQRSVKKACGIDIFVGIDSPDLSLTRSYMKAKKALRAAKNFPNRICFYNDITLETFIDEIAPESRQEFIRHIFSGYTDDEIAKWVQLLQVYFDTNGSINRASEKLLMHKNTFQYRLKKLHEQTGRDPRHITDAALYYLALQFYKN
jgi:carbohydrate diacid regulator